MSFQDDSPYNQQSRLVSKDALLLEEPLAAFYNWLFYREHKTTDFSTVLVIDVGGGTTDFSLLRHEKETGTDRRWDVICY